MPKISIIVPVYNTEKYLNKCLESIVKQTLTDIEIICINDNSKDNSLTILNSYASLDNRIKIINLTSNQGVSKARNIGIKEAIGEYIGFVDSDDFIELNFCEKLYIKAQTTQSEVVKGNIYDYCENTKKSFLSFFYDTNEKIMKNKAFFCYGFTSAIYKTEFIKSNNILFPENITHFEDPYFSILISLFLNKLEFQNDAIYYYTKHENSACSNDLNLNKTSDFIKSIKLIIDKINSTNIKKDDYFIYSNFLLEQLIPWCSNTKIPDKDNVLAVNGLFNLINSFKYKKEEIFEYYFLNKKKNIVLQKKFENIKMAKLLRERISR